MEFEVSYSLEDEQQFWDELDDIVSAQCQSHELIDDALRNYLRFTTNFKDEYLQSDYDIAKCSFRLLDSELFKKHKDYVRRQIIYGLLQEDDAPTLHLIAAFLLFDGRNNDQTFQMMQQEGVFPRLVELAHSSNFDGPVYRLILELLYEMSRMQKLSWQDLTAVDDTFTLHLFKLIEELADDVDDPYVYPIIRVLLVLNEQYMLHTSTSPQPLTNRVLKALSTHASAYKTFGSHLILLLNRESETSLQLLILKFLYMLFQSPSTAEYFYTNDLYVLLDVILRNLLDLPAESAPAIALRHTYLRVLHPLLGNSQLRRSGMGYKRDEICKILAILSNDGKGDAFGHFAPADETTVRLAKRCLDVPWLRPPEEKKVDAGTGAEGGDGQKEVAQRLLGMQIQEAGQSALSVVEVAEHREKPGVLSPSKEKGITGEEAEES